MPAIKATLVGLKKLDEALKKADLRTRAAARTSVDKTSRTVQLALRADVGRIFTRNRVALDDGRYVVLGTRDPGERHEVLELVLAWVSAGPAPSARASRQRKTAKAEIRR